MIDSNTYKSPNVNMRQGADDAFKKPSLVGERRIAYQPPRAGCVGMLKDSRQHHNG